MFVATLTLTLVAVGLLSVGLWFSSPGLLTGSVVASVSAALVLVAATRRRRTTAAQSPYTVRAHAVPARVVGNPAVGTHAVGTHAVPAQEGARPTDVAAFSRAAAPADEPGPQAVSAEDAARVAAMGTHVWVVDSRPRYHLVRCVHLLGRESQALSAAEAVARGFTPCSLCEPASALLAQARGP